MAAVLDALAFYVKKLIADMAQGEVSVLLGVSGEITALEDNMESLKAFLGDAERRRLTDQSAQRWVRKLKNAMYDATDILDLCQLEADKRRELDGDRDEQNLLACCQPLLTCLRSPIFTLLITCGGTEKMKDFFQRFLFCGRNPVFAHQIGSRIKELNQQLDDIGKGAREFSFNINPASYTERRTLTSAEFSSYKTRAQIDESAIVGEQIERDTKELVQVLTTIDDNYRNIKVVSVIGTGGLGKTTLAQRIFNDATIQEHFKTKIWLSINQHFDDVDLLRTAIKHAGGVHGGEQDKSSLTDILIRTLTSTGRFLLVMDDVWSERAWDDVLGLPIRNASRNQPGSWALVTTRSAQLPQLMQAPLHEHRVSPLDQDDAWCLLKKQLRPEQVLGIDQLKKIGMEILMKCDGLPLAIKVVGGLLSTRYASEREWNAVLSKPAWSLTGLPLELDNRLYLSYEDLSPQLKQCFLYCSLFPKGQQIIQQIVTHMWVSEGFVQPQDESSSSTSSHEYGLEDIATECYRELINRNLIEATKESYLTGYMCTMHDVVRSFAEHVAREESLVVVDKQQAATGGSGGMLVRRLSVGYTISAVEWADFQRQESLRTLIINSRINFKPCDSLGSFSSLRVLYIRSAVSDTLAPSLPKLQHLRYLHLEDTDVSRLPDDMHKMKFLRYITLFSCDKLCYLPSRIVQLVHLRSIDISESNVSVVPKDFGGLTKLRFLYGFPVHVDVDSRSDWCSLHELAPLNQLRYLALYGLKNVPASWMAENAMISNKGHLSYLELNYSASRRIISPRSGAEQQPQQQQQFLMEEVLEKLRPPTCLETLIVEGGYIGRQLPNWMCAPVSSDFKSLRYLSLENLPCCTHLPDGLCCLPRLEGLNVKHAPAIKRVGLEFQASSSLAAGDSAATSPAPFPKLRVLQLEGLCAWEEWEWSGGDSEEEQFVQTTIAMPFLERLTIDNSKLSYLPPGLATIHRHALRVLNLYEMANLTSVDNFPSVVELDVFDCSELKRISGLSRLQKIRIVRCPNLQALEGVPALDSMVLEHATMDTLPEYLTTVKPRFLKLNCGKKMHESLSPGSFEWNKIKHIEKRNIVRMEVPDLDLLLNKILLKHIIKIRYSDSHEDPDED